MNEDFYDDWFSDYKEDLIKEFIEEHYDEFKVYCQEEFNNFVEEIKWK